MKYLIDFNLFLFDCTNVSNNTKNLKFTYKTNKAGFNKLNKGFFDKLKEICNSKDFHTQLSKKQNDHNVDTLEAIEKIAFIFKDKKYPNKWIDEHIRNSLIYQAQFISKKQRIFFITERMNTEIFIIKPLFLDLNHAIFPNNSRDNVRYENCLICHNEKCH